MRDGGELRTVPRCVVVKLEEWDGEELHVFGYGEDLCARAWSTTYPQTRRRVVRTALGHLNQEQLLALLRLRYMRRDEGVLEDT